MTEFQTGLPSIRQIQGFIKEATLVQMRLLTNELLTGRVRWQDQHCICLLDDTDNPIVIWRHAIAYIKPESGGGGSRAVASVESQAMNIFE
jgi:host factor-I protein